MKHNKTQLNNNQLDRTRELSLLIASHTYLNMEIANPALDGITDKEYLIAKELVTKLDKVIGSHTDSFRHKSATIFHDIIIKKDDDVRVSVVVLGLELLARHSEVRGKKIIVGLDNRILALQDLIYTALDPSAIDTANDYADSLYESLKAIPNSVTNQKKVK